VNRLLLIALLALCGCNKGSTASNDPPPKPTTAPQTNVTKAVEETPKPTAKDKLCDRAFANMLVLLKDGPAPSLERMRREKPAFMTKCSAQPDDVVACIADAKDGLAMTKCSGLQPDAIKPDENMRDLCEQAYTHSIEIVTREGAPESVLAQMADRREAAVTDCTREDPALVRCILAAPDAQTLRTCRQHKQPKVSAEHRAACEGAHANLLKVVVPGKDMPKQAIESMRKQRDRFVGGCISDDQKVAECMTTAKDFDAFKACAVPTPTPTPDPARPRTAP